MAAHAPITGARLRAPILPAVLDRFETAATVPAAPLQLSRSDRAWLGDMIDTLIAILDYAGGDPDLEDGDMDRCLAGEDGPVMAPGFDQRWRAAA